MPKRGFADEIMPYTSARPPVRKKTRPESTKRNRGVFQTLLVFVVSVLVINALFGARVRETLERHFDLAALLFLILLLGGFVVLRVL